MAVSRNQRVRYLIWNQALKTYRRGTTIITNACRRICNFFRTIILCSRLRDVPYSDQEPVHVLSVQPITPRQIARLRYSISIDNLPGSVGESETRERILLERHQIGSRPLPTHRNRRPPNLPTLLALLQALEMYENPSQDVREQSLSQDKKKVVSENPGGDRWAVANTGNNKEKETSSHFLEISKVSTVKKETIKEEEELDVWDVESLETLTDKDEENM